MSCLPRRLGRTLVVRVVAAVAVAAAVVPAGGDAARAGPAQAPTQVRTVASGLAVPWGLAVLPDGSALVTERDRFRLVHVAPSGEATEVGTVAGVVPGGEGGLLGVAVSPQFASDRFVYLYYTAAQDNRIVRARYEGGRLGEQEVLVSAIPKGRIHNGGRLAFGPDGMLYAGVGETGNVNLAQDVNSLGGKILRMTPEGRPAPGNPFANLVWSYGHRNVQGLAWDDAGRLYATEFGQNTYDEVNLIEAGRNYGWPTVEGRSTDTRFTNPLVTWTTAEASPSGVAFHDGALWVAALRGQRLWRVPLNGDGTAGAPQAQLTGQYGRLRAVTAVPDGTLWVTTSNRDGRGLPAAADDRVLAVTPGEGEPPGGCVAATNSAHVEAGRAVSFLVFAWAVGSGDYLGATWSTTALRASSPGVWDLVDAC